MLRCQNFLFSNIFEMKKIFLALASFVALTNLGAGNSISCPDPESVYPCTCKPLAIGLHITCANFEDKGVLINAFRALRDYKVRNKLLDYKLRKVVLHGLMLKEVLPDNLADGLEIYELLVQKSNLKFPHAAFSGLDESLHILNVQQHSIIECSKNFVLANLNNLTELNFMENPIEKVKNEWFNGSVPNVKKIRLEEDNIMIIENQAFANLFQLQFVSLAGNRIKSVERSMFARPANFLEEINLSGNEIKTLPLDFFHQMPKLKEVVLNENHLTTLREMVWKPVWQDLRTVRLMKNNLTCDDSLDWLRDLRWPKLEVNAECGRPEGLVGKSLKDVYKT